MEPHEKLALFAQVADEVRRDLLARDERIADLERQLAEARKAVSLLMLELRAFGFSDNTLQAIINPPAPKEKQ